MAAGWTLCPRNMLKHAGSRAGVVRHAWYVLSAVQSTPQSLFFSQARLDNDTMDHSHMDHGHMDHDMPGMDHGHKCNMNVRRTLPVLPKQATAQIRS